MADHKIVISSNVFVLDTDRERLVVPALSQIKLERLGVPHRVDTVLDRLGLRTLPVDLGHNIRIRRPVPVRRRKRLCAHHLDIQRA